MAQFRPVVLAIALTMLAAPALADGSGGGLSSLRGVGSTQDLNRPTSGRIGGIAVDPSDSSGARHFNGVVNRVSQGTTEAEGADAAAVDQSGRLVVGTDQGVWRSSANGGVWKTTNGGGTATNNPGVGFLRSMDGGKTWSAPAGGGGGTGALQNVGGSNTWSKPGTTTPPAGPAALRAKAN